MQFHPSQFFMVALSLRLATGCDSSNCFLSAIIASSPSLPALQLQHPILNRCNATALVGTSFNFTAFLLHFTSFNQMFWHFPQRSLLAFLKIPRNSKRSDAGIPKFPEILWYFKKFLRFPRDSMIFFETLSPELVMPKRHLLLCEDIPDDVYLIGTFSNLIDFASAAMQFQVIWTYEPWCCTQDRWQEIQIRIWYQYFLHNLWQRRQSGKEFAQQNWSLFCLPTSTVSSCESADDSFCGKRAPLIRRCLSMPLWPLTSVLE